MFRASLHALLASLLIAGCAQRTSQDSSPQIFSYQPEILETAPFIGRITEHNGCVVLLTDVKDFEANEAPDPRKSKNVAIPIFVNKPTISMEDNGFILTTENGFEFRDGDRVEGIGGLVWSEASQKRPPDIPSSVKLGKKTACGNSVLQVRQMKNYGKPNP